MIKQILPWALVVILSIGVGFLFNTNLNQEDLINLIDKSNKEQLNEIHLKDSIIFIQSQKIDSLDVIEHRVIEAINKMQNDYDEIPNKYKDIYLNPDSSDWRKLDSLATVILNR